MTSFEKWQFTMVMLTSFRNAICLYTRVLIDPPSYNVRVPLKVNVFLQNIIIDASTIQFFEVNILFIKLQCHLSSNTKQLNGLFGEYNWLFR